MMIFPCLVLQCLLGLIMFGGDFLTSFFPEAGVQERMKEHGKDPLWKIKYEEHFIYLRISLIESKWCYKVIWLIRLSMKIIFLTWRVCIFRYASNGSTLFTACDRGSRWSYWKIEDCEQSRPIVRRIRNSEEIRLSETLTYVLAILQDIWTSFCALIRGRTIQIVYTTSAWAGCNTGCFPATGHIARACSHNVL